MPKNNVITNSRKAARWACDSIAITWERDGKLRRRPGWLNDISSIGVGYFTARTGAPKPGDSVTLTPRRSSDAIAGKVVRVRPMGAGLCLVGCERMDPAAGGIAPSPSPQQAGQRLRPRPTHVMPTAA